MSNQKVNIYAYIAASNPYFAKSLAHKYGYEFDKQQSLSSVLQQLVSYEGEPVLMEIIENHPDKELFMEFFEKQNSTKDVKPTAMNEVAQYMNFSGQVVAANQTAENRRLTQDTSLMVLAGAVLIAFAIMSKK
jgi:hypothetical protein